MLKRVVVFAFFAAVMTFASVGFADILIDATTGNGDFRSDDAGVTFPAATNVNGAGTLAYNNFGRALVDIGGAPGGDMSDFTTITDNPGVEFGGWGVYRHFFDSGNSGMGLIENGGRLGKLNSQDDGMTFSNSSDYVLFSDAIAVTGFAGDTLDFSILAGTDTGGGSFDLETFLIFDEAPVALSIQDDTGQTTSGLTFSGTSIAAADFSSVRIAFFVDATQSPATRVLLDDARLNLTSTVPEPNSIALLGFCGLIAGIRRRR